MKRWAHTTRRDLVNYRNIFWINICHIICSIYYNPIHASAQIACKCNKFACVQKFTVTQTHLQPFRQFKRFAHHYHDQHWNEQRIKKPSHISACAGSNLVGLGNVLALRKGLELCSNCGQKSRASIVSCWSISQPHTHTHIQTD